MLKDESSAIDLMLRGFDREAVQSKTGVDIGYHGSGLRTESAGIDRFQYKVAHVRERVSTEQRLAALESYATGASKVETLGLLGLAGENIVKLKHLYAALDLSVEFKDADRRARKFSMAAGMTAKHGVDNPFKLAQFQAQAEQTREELYGAKYTLAAGSTLAEDARETFKQKMSDPEFATKVLEQRKATNLERYGVEHASQGEAAKEKTRETFLQNYGVLHPSQSDVVQLKKEGNSLQRYSVTHPSQRPESRQRQSLLGKKHGREWAAKARVTNLERYGVESVSQLPVYRQRQSEAMRATGIERAKLARQTNLERYGVDHPSQLAEVRARKSMILRRTGKQRAAKARQTSLARYGVISALQLPVNREMQSKRMLDPEHQKRINAAKRLNKSFNTSKPEDALHTLLVEHFGPGDVLTQYRDDRYPYRCDFYVPPRDLFVELNGIWTHGNHWFDESSESDAGVVERWRAKGTKFYEVAIEQWCRRDVSKRSAARESELNYVVFWDSRYLSDASMWLSEGAPDGNDWEEEYSWKK